MFNGTYQEQQFVLIQDILKWGEWKINQKQHQRDTTGIQTGAI